MKPTLALQLIIIAVATTALFFLRWDLGLTYLIGLAGFVSGYLWAKL